MEIAWILMPARPFYSKKQPVISFLLTFAAISANFISHMEVVFLEKWRFVSRRMENSNFFSIGENDMIIRKILTVTILVLLSFSFAAEANPTMVCDFEDLTTSDCSGGYLKAWSCNGLDTVSWDHSNPFDSVGDYWIRDASGAMIVNPCIIGATLTVNVSGLNPADDHAGLLFIDRLGVEHALWQDYGLLTNGDNVFTIEREWLNGVDVIGGIKYVRDGLCDWSDCIRINWSRLCVTYQCQPIPVPGALAMSSMGLATVFYLRRRRII
jgi:hypothetical protein